MRSAFGGFVAFSTYLPTYLKTIYDFSLTDAGARTAGFAIAAVIARPIGGILSDRIHPKIVVMISLAGTSVLAAVVLLQPAPEIAAGATFIAMAFFLGIGTGGVFAWVALSSPPDRVGAVTGIVGAAGGLGGLLPAPGHGRDLRLGRQRLHHGPRAAQPGQPAGPAVHGLAAARAVAGGSETTVRPERSPPTKRKQIDERSYPEPTGRSQTSCCGVAGSSPAATSRTTCER